MSVANELNFNLIELRELLRVTQCNSVVNNKLT